MKRFFAHAVLLVLIFLGGTVFCQESYSIPESGETIICGSTVIVDGIWFAEGIIRADISILETPRSKAITGGYRAGDEITITSEPGCTYYVNSITKSGLTSSKGKVILSKDPLGSPINICTDEYFFFENTSFMADTMIWHIRTIGDSDSGKLAAFITVTYQTQMIEDIMITQSDQLWISGCLYYVSCIERASRDVLPDPQGHYEFNPGSLRLLKVK